MSARDLIQEALHSLEANKGRSLLTILGIVIGIASFVAVFVGHGQKIGAKFFAHRRHPKQLGQQPGPQRSSHGSDLFVPRTL